MPASALPEGSASHIRIKTRNAGLRSEDRTEALYTVAPVFRLAAPTLTGAVLLPLAAPSLGRFSARRKPRDTFWTSILAEGCRIAALLPEECSLSLPMEIQGKFPDDFLMRLADMIMAGGISAFQLELEFSESSLALESDDLFFTLAALRDQGMGLALSGFGAGTSSLTLLRDRSLSGLLTAIKLDRHLLLHEDPLQKEIGFTLVRNLVSLGRSLGLKTQIDGVDTAETLDFLKQVGCDEGRGKILGAPATVSRFLETYFQHPTGPEKKKT